MGCVATFSDNNCTVLIRNCAVVVCKCCNTFHITHLTTVLIRNFAVVVCKCCDTSRISHLNYADMRCIELSICKNMRAEEDEESEVTQKIWTLLLFHSGVITHPVPVKTLFYRSSSLPHI